MLRLVVEVDKLNHYRNITSDTSTAESDAMNVMSFKPRPHLASCKSSSCDGTEFADFFLRQQNSCVQVRWRFFAAGPDSPAAVKDICKGKIVTRVHKGMLIVNE